DVTFTLTEVTDLGVCHGQSVFRTDYTMDLDPAGAAVCQLVPPDKIRVFRPGVILRFSVVRFRGSAYLPIGIAFSQVITPARSRAVPCETGPVRTQVSPFGNLIISGGVLEITDQLPPARKRSSANPTFTEYRFSLLLQRGSDGALGLIDPVVENEN
ncbi:MAG: hypothetical protein HZC55_07965, partial [Verrucomicrobia bacterium]|nr:hypothetical protein [Verrucomicrobiota bacterium]